MNEFQEGPDKWQPEGAVGTHCVVVWTDSTQLGRNIPCCLELILPSVGSLSKPGSLSAACWTFSVFSMGFLSWVAPNICKESTPWAPKHPSPTLPTREVMGTHSSFLSFPRRLLAAGCHWLPHAQRGAPAPRGAPRTELPGGLCWHLSLPGGLGAFVPPHLVDCGWKQGWRVEAIPLG